MPVGRRRWACLIPEFRYDFHMRTKEIAIRTIEQLPENASWEDIHERINCIAGFRKGLKELDEGRGIPHDRVKEESARVWHAASRRNARNLNRPTRALSPSAPPSKRDGAVRHTDVRMCSFEGLTEDDSVAP